MEGPTDPAPPAPTARADWEGGDPAKASAPLVFAAERLCEAVELRFGETVVDVGAGTGNLALAAARRGARVVALDLRPPVLAMARTRAWSETLKIRLVAGAAEQLPFRNDRFGVTLSSFGVIFANDPDSTTDELVRVTLPGGRVGLNAWTPEGLIGKVYRAAREAAQEPESPDPASWGVRDHLSEWFGSAAAEMATATRTVRLRGPSVEQFVDYLSATLGPLQRAMAASTPEAQAALRGQLVEICTGFNTVEDGSFLAPSEYLEVVVKLR